MQIGKKSTLKDKAIPFAAGAAVTAGAVVGVAAAKALSDKKTRKKVVKGLTTAKKQAMTTVSDMVEKQGEVMGKVKSKASKMMTAKPVKSTAKKVKVVRNDAMKKADNVVKDTEKKASSAKPSTTKKSPERKESASTNHQASSAH